MSPAPPSPAITRLTQPTPTDPNPPPSLYPQRGDRCPALASSPPAPPSTRTSPSPPPQPPSPTTPPTSPRPSPPPPHPPRSSCWRRMRPPPPLPRRCWPRAASSTPSRSPARRSNQPRRCSSSFPWPTPSSPQTPSWVASSGGASVIACDCEGVWAVFCGRRGSDHQPSVDCVWTVYDLHAFSLTHVDCILIWCKRESYSHAERSHMLCISASRNQQHHKKSQQQQYHQLNVLVLLRLLCLLRAQGIGTAAERLAVGAGGGVWGVGCVWGGGEGNGKDRLWDRASLD